MSKKDKKGFFKKHSNNGANPEGTFEYSDFGLTFNGELDLGDGSDTPIIKSYEQSVSNDAFDDFDVLDSVISEEQGAPIQEASKIEKKALKDAEKKEKRISKEEKLIRKYEEELARKDGKKKYGFKGFLKLVFPWKGDDAMELTRKSILLVAFTAFLVSAYILANFALASVHNQQVIDEVRELYKNPNYDLTGVDFPEGANKADFAALYVENNDTVGWIHIPNTKIDNVVVKGYDNDYYLNYDFYKKKSEHGTIMVDFRAVFSVSSNSKNIPIYGHHMKDGSMFATLEKYRTISFYKANPVVYFDTLYSKGKYEIFSVFITNDLETEDNGYRFNFNQVNFTSEDEFMQYITQVRRRSIYNTAVTVSPTDEIITLSTCVYDFNEARLVICARRLLDGEQPTDTSTAIRNPKPLYPQAWYDKKGGSKPIFNDSSSVPPITNDESNPSSVTSSDTVSSQISSDNSLPPIISPTESTDSGSSEDSSAESSTSSGDSSSVESTPQSSTSSKVEGGEESKPQSSTSSKVEGGEGSKPQNTSGSGSSSASSEQGGPKK